MLMMDLVYIGVTAVFFAVAVAYTFFCKKI